MGEMAAAGAIPGFFEKRELIYAAQPDATALRAQGRRLLEGGLLEAALESFALAGDTAGIGEVAAAARAAGDAFAYEAALKALGKAPAAAEWVALGETAFAAGMLWFAYRAFEKADHQDGLERARRAMHDAGLSPGHP
jgi:tetratricopeptide (TPR) repeat protein